LGGDLPLDGINLGIQALGDVLGEQGFVDGGDAMFGEDR
jgi:hypothetical protein